MRRKEADRHRVVPLHLSCMCSEKGDSRLVYGFFQLSRNVYGLLRTGAGNKVCREASVRSGRAASSQTQPIPDGSNGLTTGHG